MTILQEFSETLKDYGYNRGFSPCFFDEDLVFTDLCHMIPNRKDYNKYLSRNFMLSYDMADVVIDLPLINVIPGNRVYNVAGSGSRKIAGIEDVTYVDTKVVKAARKAIYLFLKGVEINDETFDLFDFLLSHAYSYLDKLEKDPKREILIELHNFYKDYYKLQ